MGVAAAWDRYWRADRIASCMDGAGQSNYDDRVAAGWRAFFRTLPAGSRILDLCTGNGAVAIIAAEVGVAHGKGFAIIGIDLADIDPARFVSRYGVIAKGITFVPRTNCESLSFPDSCFDAVVSQYGVEYSDLEKTLPEIVRVLAPGAHLRLFMHAREGTVVAETRTAIADADFLLDRTRICDKAAACFRAVHAVESGSAGADEAKADRCFAAFRSALDCTTNRLRKATDEAMIRNCVGVLLHAYENRFQCQSDAMVAKAAELKAEIAAHRSRQRALVYAAVNAARMAKLATALAALGMVDIGWKEVRPGTEFVGYVLEGEKRKA